MAIRLYEDQQLLKNDIYYPWNNGFHNILAVLPTGGGKSVIVSDIVLDGVRAGMRQAVIAHRNELVAQMSMHLANRGIQHRIIGSKTTIAQITRQHRKEHGQSFVNPSAPTAVVGVDTLVSRADSLKEWALQIDRWVIDEAHHVLVKNKWGKAVEMFKNAKGLGVTATPLRADGHGLGRDFDGVFDHMSIGMSMSDLIKRGRLAEYEIVCPKSDLHVDNSSIGTTGDWSTQKLKKASKASHIVGDVAQKYCQFAYGKQAICFATDVETAGDIANSFNKIGIRAVALSAKTNTAVREKYIQEFRDGKLLVLVNVDLFDEGFDVPACEVVIMARPTASLGKYRQMVGRCLRVADGKLCGLIIDHVSNVIRHGFPDKYIEWSLARRDKRGKQEKDPNEIELTTCSECTRPYEKFYHACPYCGFVEPLPEPRSRSIEMVEGDLILLDRETIEKMRASTEVESPGSIASRVAMAAGEFAGRGAASRQYKKIEAQERLSTAIAQWAAIERVNGFDDRHLYKKFYLTTGIDVLSAMDGTKTRQEFEQLAEKVERWYA